MTRRYDPRRAKPYLTYTAQELADLYGVVIGTVRQWHKDGLTTIDRARPYLYAGSEVAGFLAARNKPRQPMEPGQIHCVACKRAVRPLNGEVETVDRTPTSLDLRGVCPTCGCKIFRRVRIGEMSEKLGDLRVRNEDA